MSVGGFLRVLRAAVFAAVCVVLAALGHVLMSGEGLPGWVLLSGASADGASRLRRGHRAVGAGRLAAR